MKMFYILFAEIMCPVLLHIYMGLSHFVLTKSLRLSDWLKVTKWALQLSWGLKGDYSSLPLCFSVIWGLLAKNRILHAQENRRNEFAGGIH